MFKKRIVNVLFLLPFCCSLLGQSDWSPAPFGAMMYYQNQTSNEIIAMKADSSIADSSKLRNFIFRKHINESPVDCDSTILFGFDEYSEDNSLLFYEYTIAVDTIYFHANRRFNSERLKIPLRCDSGEISQFNSNYLIRFDSSAYQLHFGTLDSLKFYSILTSASSETGLNITLSKHFGLISTPSLKHFYWEFKPQNDYDTYVQVGWKDSLGQSGLELPSSNDFFPFTAGDRFFYRNEIERFPWSPDYSRCVGFDQLKLDSFNLIQGKYFGEKEFYNQNKVKSNSECEIDLNHMVFKAAHFLDSIGIPGIQYSKGYHSNFDLFYPKLFFDSVQGFQMSAEWNNGNCQYSGIDAPRYEATYIEAFGLITFSEFAGYFGSKSKRLIAAETSNGNYGTWPINLSIESTNHSEIDVWPNPTNGVIHFKNASSDFSVKVFSVNGKALSQSSQSLLDMSAFPAGVYILEITDSDRTFHEKVIKSE